MLSEAMYGARQLAMTRMEEADQLGADGVVGVRLDIGRYEWGQDMAEFISDRHGGQAPRGHAGRNGRPFTSSQGRTSGRCCAPGVPWAVVMGGCVSTTWRTAACSSRWLQTGRNVELANSTSLYDAREWAMERMQSEAQSAEGIVGVEEEAAGWAGTRSSSSPSARRSCQAGGARTARSKRRRRYWT